MSSAPSQVLRQLCQLAQGGLGVRLRSAETMFYMVMYKLALGVAYALSTAWSCCARSTHGRPSSNIVRIAAR